MLRVALTGGIATGKSFVLGCFAERDVPTADADRIAHEAVQPGRPAWSALRTRFGPEMFAQDGTINRKRLASHIFDNPVVRADLEAIVHPHVRAAIDKWFDQCSLAGVAPFCVADIPLLFETGRAKEFDRVIVTACDKATQLARLMNRDGLSEDDSQKRLTAQLSTLLKTARADFVIHTDESFNQTDRQVEKVYRTLCNDAG